MLSHEFTRREKAFLLIFAILALGMFYYLVVWRSIGDQISAYNTEDIQTQIQLEAAKAAQKAKMERVIEESEGKVVGEISVYNNQSNEIIAMSAIFNEDADNVSLSWSDPVLDGTIVRRQVAVSFHTTSYQNLLNVLQKMSEMQYRCLIGDLTVSGYSPDSDAGIQHSNDINATMNVTFFETTDGAVSLAGLDVPAEEDSEPGALEERAHAYDDQ